MEAKEMTERIRQKKFFCNNGVVLNGINLLRTQYVSLSELRYALEPTIAESELRDSVNYLSECGYIKMRSMQRKMERDMRARKRELSAYQTAIETATNNKLLVDFKTDFNVSSVKLKNQENELANFLEETGELPDASRLWSNGFNKSLSQKAVWANRKSSEFQNLIGTVICNGYTVSNISEHFAARSVARNISVEDIRNALTNPLNIGKIRTDSKGRKSMEFIGNKARPQLNPDTGNLTTVWETSSELRKKYGGDP